MNINGKEIDFKISRLECAAKMDSALHKMGGKEKEIKEKETSLPGIIKSMISMFRNFFIDATGVDVLENCTDLEEAKESYLEFLKEVKGQKEKVLGITLDDIK